MATYIWQRRSRVSAILIAIVAAGFIVTQIRWAQPARATSGGSAYSGPIAVDTNPDPMIFEMNLEAKAETVNIGGAGILAEAGTADKWANMLTFNGTAPGPEIHLTVGQTVIIHYKNSLGHQSGIHWHGIELNNHSDGTPLSQDQVDPGGTYLYKFVVTRPGIFWYHPHHHSSTNQVFKGLYGAIVITDPNEAALIGNKTIPPDDPQHTLTLALSDVTVCKSENNDQKTYDLSKAWSHVSGSPLLAQNSVQPIGLCESAMDEDGGPRGPFGEGDVPNIQPAAPNMVSVVEGQTVLTNGRNVGGRAGSPASPGALSVNAETYPVQPGQGLRLRLGNAAAVRFFRLRLTTQAGAMVPLIRIGGQGGLLDNAYQEVDPIPGGGNTPHFDPGEILLDPGDRADVVASIPDNVPANSVLTLWTEDFQRTGGGSGYSNIPTVPVAHFKVTGAVVSPAFSLVAGTQLRAQFPGQEVENLGILATTDLVDPTPFTPFGTPDPDIKLTSHTPSFLGINDIQGTHDSSGSYLNAERPESARWALIGSVLELTVTNKTGAHHPYHLHGFSMWPMKMEKQGSNVYLFPHEFRDNIDVPNGATLTFRVRLDDRPLVDGVTPGGGLGRWVFHCHIFFHASFGMISELDVVTERDILLMMRPHIDVIDRVIFVNPGDPVEVRGVYWGVGNIKLNASIGQIKEVVVGTRTEVTPEMAAAVRPSTSPVLHNFLWTYTPKGGEKGFVYVTATSATGRDEAAFPIDVDSAPAVAASDARGSEGSAIPIHGTASDANGDPLVTTWTYAPAGGVDPGTFCTFGDEHALDTTITCNDNGNFLLTLTADDGRTTKSDTAKLVVANVPPRVEITSPPDQSMYGVGFTVAVTAHLIDPGSNDTLKCTINWGDGTPATTVEANSDHNCSATHAFMRVGTFNVTVVGSDDDGGKSGPAAVSIIVMRPS